jgi:hypothetical protein
LFFFAGHAVPEVALADEVVLVAAAEVVLGWVEEVVLDAAGSPILELEEGAEGAAWLDEELGGAADVLVAKVEVVWLKDWVLEGVKLPVVEVEESVVGATWLEELTGAVVVLVVEIEGGVEDDTWLEELDEVVLVGRVLFDDDVDVLEESMLDDDFTEDLDKELDETMLEAD